MSDHTYYVNCDSKNLSVMKEWIERYTEGYPVIEQFMQSNWPDTSFPRGVTLRYVQRITFSGDNEIGSLFAIRFGDFITDPITPYVGPKFHSGEPQ